MNKDFFVEFPNILKEKEIKNATLHNNIVNATNKDIGNIVQRMSLMTDGMTRVAVSINIDSLDITEYKRDVIIKKVIDDINSELELSSNVLGKLISDIENYVVSMINLTIKELKLLKK